MVGIFITTVLGGLVSALWAIAEFFIGTKQQANELGSTWWEEIMAEFKFTMKCFGTTKVSCSKNPPEYTACGHRMADRK